MSVRPVESRVPAADVLRALCCLVVVTMHAFIAAETQPGLDRSYEFVALVGYQLSLWATPLFAVLSGFVIFHTSRGMLSAGAFWKRRLAVVATPFLFWTVVYSLVHPEAGHPGKAVIGALLGLAGQRHLYFVAMILQFYALFPLLAAYCKKSSVRRLLAPALVITLGHLAFFTYVPAAAGPLGAVWEFSDSLLPGWWFYLVVGAALAESPEAILGFARRRPALAWGLLVTGAGLMLLEYLLSPIIPRDYGSRRPMVLVYCVMALPLLWFTSERLATLPIYRWSRSLAACSFAVYLVHPLALHLVRITIPVPADLAIRVVLYCVGCAGLTSGLIAVASRLPFGPLLLGLPKAQPRCAEASPKFGAAAPKRSAPVHPIRELVTSRD